MFLVNADDYGYNHDFNLAITNCFDNGLIDYSTLMVNMPGTYEALTLIRKKNNTHKIGLHLNITEGEPLTNQIKACSVFCDSKGNFRPFFKKNIIYRFWLPKKARKALEVEIKAQIDKFLSFGLQRKHIDSHHHAHKYYSVFKVLVKVLREYNWETMRIALNTGKPSLNKLYNSWINRRIFKSRIKPLSDYLFGTLESAYRCRNSFSSYKCEVEVHPKTIGDKIKDHDIPMSAVKELKEIHDEVI